MNKSVQKVTKATARNLVQRSDADNAIQYVGFSGINETVTQEVFSKHKDVIEDIL